jgi:hypothetical protein
VDSQKNKVASVTVFVFRKMYVPFPGIHIPWLLELRASGSGSAWIRIKLKVRIRILKQSERKDPDPHLHQLDKQDQDPHKKWQAGHGSGSA